MDVSQYLEIFVEETKNIYKVLMTIFLFWRMNRRTRIPLMKFSDLPIH